MADANIYFGKPCVADTRIPVPNVLELVDKVFVKNIIQNYYPHLEAGDIRAGGRYVMDVITAEDIHISASA